MMQSSEVSKKIYCPNSSLTDTLRDMSRRVITTRTTLASDGITQSRTPVAHQDAILLVHDCCKCFENTVRYLSSRRANPSLVMDSEANVQDVLFMLLKPSIPDLEWENPDLKVGGRSWRPDFTSSMWSIAIEAKYVRDQRHGKMIVGELDEDIASARDSASWQDLVLFIYDPGMNIPDVSTLVMHCDGTHFHDGKSVRVHTMVIPSSCSVAFVSADEAS